MNAAARPQDLVERALSVATLPCVLWVTEHAEANLRWANNALISNGDMRSRRLTVTATAEVADGIAAGTVTQEIAGAEDVNAVVSAAEYLARAARAAEDVAPMVANYDHNDVWEEPPETTSIDVLGELAKGLGVALDSAHAARHLLFGFAEHAVGTTYLGSTTGLRRRGVQRTGRLEVNGKTADLESSAWLGRATRDFTDVDVAEVVDELTTRLAWAAKKLDLPPGRYETLLPPSAIADLMIYAYWTANARDAEEGRNVFAGGNGTTKIGRRLAEHPINLRSDPQYPGLETMPFVDFAASADGTSWAFDGGLPIKPTTWIQDGALNELIRNRAHAARTGSQPTPPADNLIMDGGGTASLEHMISTTKRGLLLTGLTRDGVYLVEDGEVIGAVNNFRFNDSPVELLGRISEIGAAELTLCREWNDYFNRTIMPPVRVPDFNMSTVSQAS